MIRSKLVSIVLSAGILLGAGFPGPSESKEPTASAVREMQITGEIAKSNHGYIIRGKVPAEVFTILNPYPDQLARFMGEGRISRIDVRIVSGDNVEIEKIDGKKYGPDGK